MDFELAARTEAGWQFVELAEKHARQISEHADRHDADGTFPVEAFRAMADSGFLAATLPRELGGLEVATATDIAAAFNRLARGDASVALAAHMHTVVTVGLSRLWRELRRAGSTPDWLTDLMRAIGEHKAVVCVAGTEPGQTIGWFQTVGRPADGGYLVSGRKTFASNSPVASHLYVMFRVPARAGEWLNAVAIVDRDAEGVEVLDDWDPLGMRGSGSNSVVLNQCFVPGDRVLPVGEPRRLSRYWVRFFVEGNVGLLASFVGVAEAARDAAIAQLQAKVSTVTGASVATRAGLQHSVAEIEVHVAAARAGVEQIARLSDEFYDADAVAPKPMEAHHRLMAEFQSTKLGVNRAAIAAVDCAATAVGGGAYLRSNPISRLYRDVRAGPFMQAYSPNEAFEYIGKVLLGQEPVLSD